jgi:hypothetical protein
VSLSALKDGGIGHPGQLLYELELLGWEFEHGPAGVRVRREPPPSVRGRRPWLWKGRPGR